MLKNRSKVISVRGRGHSQCISESILLLAWENECYADVVFVCKQGEKESEKTLTANKAILAASSKMLASLLSDTRDDDMTKILVPETTFQTMDLLLRYIYSGEVLVSNKNEDLQALIREWVCFYLS